MTPRVRTLSPTVQLETRGAAMKDDRSSIGTGIQGPGSDKIVRAGEFHTRSGGAGSGRWNGHAAPLAGARYARTARRGDRLRVADRD